MSDNDSPEVEAIATVGGVITDLVQIAERLPVQLGQVEPVAQNLDRLAEEISEAARMLRTAGSRVRSWPGSSHTRG